MSDISDTQVDKLIEELRECEGPCGQLCLHCPSAYILDVIIQMIEDLRQERNALLQEEL